MVKGSTTNLQALSPKFTLVHREEEDFPGLSFNTSIEAVRDRIFYAITTAEYMEIWLTIPSQRQGTTPIVKSNSRGFHLQYEDESSGFSTIAGCYQVCRRGRIHFTWNRGATLSNVTIILAGDFANTDLSLMHSGLSSEAERTWHRILWEESLRRMSHILKRLGPISNRKSNGSIARLMVR